MKIHKIMEDVSVGTLKVIADGLERRMNDSSDPGPLPETLEEFIDYLRFMADEMFNETN